MEWVEGETLDVYLKRNLNDKYALEMLSYRFNRMSAWLLAQPFAHGDLKPDNILVCEDGSLVLVDYDGMFVPSMKGEKAREIGSPDYRHPLRTDSDFNEHIDDFSIAVIALSLKVISINPIIKINNIGWDYLLFSEFDLINPNLSSIFKIIFSLQPNKDLSLLLGVFWIALSEKSLHKINPDLFHTEKPTSRLLPLSLKDQKDRRERVIKIRKLFTGCQVKDSDLMDCYQDEYGVKYSIDKKRLLNYSVKFPGMGCKNELYIRRWSKNRNQKKYTIIDNTTVICNNAFYQCNNIEEIVLPFSVTVLGQSAFAFCKNLTSIFIPNSVKAIGSDAFH